MNVACIADLHGHLPDTPPCDVLVVAGDVTPVRNHDTGFQTDWLRGPFTEWLETRDAHVVGVGGNHDFVLQSNEPLARSLPWTYLLNESADVDGLHVWGSPMASWFGPWAFMAHEHELADVWATIPDGVQLTITHGPPYGARDTTAGRVSAGSPSLRERIMRVRPGLHVCGHIHEAYGVDGIRYAPRGGRDVTLVANASCVDLGYTLTNKPLVFEIGGDDGRVIWKDQRRWR